MLLERERELEVLADLLGLAADSGGRVVLIRGEAGIGKSALVELFAESYADTALFVSGSCDDLSTPEPLGPIRDIARLEPDLGQAIAAGDRIVVMETLLDLMSHRLRPTVVVLEDTQWADEATLDLIRYVGRRIARTSGLLVLTYRDGEVDVEHPLRHVIGELQPGSIERMHLQPLSKPAIASLIDVAGLDVDEVFDLTGGNPLFVRELVVSAAERVPSSVRDGVLARASKLSPGARALLELVSVVPGRAELRLVEAVVDPSPGQLTECIRQGLLRVEGTDVSFRHELVRQAVESSLDAATRQRLNRLVLAELIATADPARLVHHALEAGDLASVVEFAPQAARAAMEVGSVREAGAHFRNLEPHLDLIPEGERARIMDDWARTEFMLDNPESLDILDRAMDLYRAVGDEDSLARALTFGVRSNETSFRPEAAERCAVEALAILEPKPPGPDLAAALAQRAYLGMVRLDDDVAVEYADRAIDMARETGDDLSLISSLNTKGTVRCMRGEPDGLTLLEEARWRAEQGRHLFEELRALNNMSVNALGRMDLDRAGEFSQRAMEVASRSEIPLLEYRCMTECAEVLLAKGEWTTAENLVLEMIGSHIRESALGILATIQTRRGQAAAKESVLRSWLLSEAGGQPQFLTAAAAVLAEYMWLTDDHPVGSERLRQVIHSAKIRLWSVGALAWWLWELGELDAVPDGIAPGFALTMNGDARAGAAEWDRLGYPYEKAMALTHADAKGRLEAVEILETLGATAVAAKVRREMRADGITVPRGRAEATRRHPAGLTARQAEVLTLLDQGLTNAVIADRLFVSPRTVENHVSAILVKLDAPTRKEAVVRARAASLVQA